MKSGIQGDFPFFPCFVKKTLFCVLRFNFNVASIDQPSVSEYPVVFLFWKEHSAFMEKTHKADLPVAFALGEFQLESEFPESEFNLNQSLVQWNKTTDYF